MVPMVCRKRLVYNHKRIGEGEVFQALNDKHALLLQAARKAIRVSDVPPKKEMLPEEAETEPVKPRRRYRRRDMQAEE